MRSYSTGCFHNPVVAQEKQQWREREALETVRHWAAKDEARARRWAAEDKAEAHRSATEAEACLVAAKDKAKTEAEAKDEAEDEAEACREAAVRGWRRCSGHRLEQVWRDTQGYSGPGGDRQGDL